MQMYHLFAWRDAIEILCFSTAIYYFSRWLKQDRQKNLLGYFYAYCLIVFSAHAAELHTLRYVMFVCSPAVLMMFIFIHQRTLQKNFVALRNIIPAQKDTTDWVEQLVRTCMSALYANKEITCVIERTDALNDLLTVGLKVRAQSTNLLDLLAQTITLKPNHMLWLNTNGTLLGLNATWKLENQLTLETTSTRELWLHDTRFATKKIDALVLKTECTSNTFTLIANGATREHLNAHETLALLRTSLAGSSKPLKKGDDTHAVTKTHTHPQQPRA